MKSNSFAAALLMMLFVVLVHADFDPATCSVYNPTTKRHYTLSKLMGKDVTSRTDENNDFMVRVCGVSSAGCGEDMTACATAHNGLVAAGRLDTLTAEEYNAATGVIFDASEGSLCDDGKTKRGFSLIITCDNTLPDDNPFADDGTSESDCGYIMMARSKYACPTVDAVSSSDAAPSSSPAPAPGPYFDLTACTYMSTAGYFYNLSSLKNSEFEYSDHVFKNKFSLSICSKSKKDCPPVNFDGQSVCQTDVNGVLHGAGEMSSTSASDSYSGPDQGLVLRMTGGESCDGVGPRVSYVIATCDKAQTPGKIIKIFQGACQYYIIMLSSHFCPVNN